ncbi:hypothetical protein OSC52_01200 [Clostridium pasteurianum]|uniref:hypothetical protein n=1 Tax=Clostridium pasteurianum TaxID=1501 RepID=UPI002260D1FF|nr:hypothetical protein [Clostridium pasteurianum]UZW14490.1 hypothetical protein OSC52_01200 [Clostridium pasteurianum]
MNDLNNNFHEYKKILNKIYLEIKKPRYISTYNKKDLENIINKIDNTNHPGNTDLLSKIKENISNLKFTGPEKDLEKNKKDLLAAVRELITWLG